MNKLINGDAVEFMKTLEDESIDLIITDPPYKVTARGSSGGTGGMLTKEINKKAMCLHTTL